MKHVRVAFIVTLVFFTQIRAEQDIFSYIKLTNALPDYIIVYGMVEKPELMNVFDLSGNDGESNIPKTPYANLVQYNDKDIREVFDYSNIAIRIVSFEDKMVVPLQTIGIESIKLIVGSQDTIDIELSQTDQFVHDKYIDIKNILKQNYPNGSPIYSFESGEVFDIKIDYEVPDSINVMDPGFEGEYRLSTSWYQGIDIGGAKGLWAPVLLFNSNLKADATGIPFASMPVGLAWGKKKYFKNDGYIGLSLMGNWLIYTQGEKDTDLTTINSFSFKNVGLGVLLDLNDAIYLGYAYGLDFRSGSKDPGGMFVFGFGPKLISSLKTR